MKTIEELEEEAKRFPEGAEGWKTVSEIKYDEDGYALVVNRENAFIKALKEEKNKKYHSAYDVFPLTIVSDRYGGLFSGGKYTAWNKEFFNIPEGIESGDLDTEGFWEEYRGIVGIGNTIEEAVKDLIDKLNEEYKKYEKSTLESATAAGIHLKRI